ncbi:MAG TPA: hypothetical protein HA362_05385 [Nanoarchaeota archaeon]|nr:hypothetical protein [Nanoarchaeota archaeon]
MALLIGVEHTEELTGRVIRRISHENLEGKKVMLEMSSYPIEEETRNRSPSFTNFYEGIAAFVLDKKGIVIYGEDPVLHQKAIEKMDRLGRLYREISAGYRARRDEYEKQCRQWPRIEEIPEYRLKAKQLEEERKRVEAKEDAISKESNLAPHKERDPHFARVIAKQKPDIVILGLKHMPYLIEHCFPDENYSLVRIPSDSLIAFLKKEWG